MHAGGSGLAGRHERAPSETWAHPFGAGILSLFFILFAGAAVRNRMMPGAVRALIFHRDGKTDAPFGLAHYHHRYREMGRPNTEIVSIEARGRGTDDASVVVYTRCGEVVYVAGHLHRDHAHKVAAQLTLALAELRQSPRRALAVHR